MGKKKKKYEPARRSNNEGSLIESERNGKPYYRAHVSMGFDDEGNAIRKSFSGHDKQDVIKRMNNALYEASNNIFTVGDEIKFGHFFKEWIFTYKKIELAPATFEKYETAYRLKIKPYSIAQAKVKDIRTIHLQKYFNNLINDYGVSNYSAKRLLIMIKSSLNFAVSQNMIVRNPANDIKLPKVVKEKSYNVFSKENQDTIINYLTDSTMDRLIKFAFATGLRIGEILGITWDNIKGNIVSVEKQYVYVYDIKEDGTRTREYKFADLKTDRSKRKVPIPNEIAKMLEIHKKEQKVIKMKNRNKYDDQSIVFADDFGKPIEKKRPGRRLDKICKDLEIENKTFHALRHSYATRLFELGVPVKTVQELMGHTDITTTMNIYTHVMPEQIEEAVSKLNELFK